MTQNYEPKVVQEIHAIRREIHAETLGMSPNEKRAFFHNGTEAFFARRGLTPKYFNTDKPDTKGSAKAPDTDVTGDLNTADATTTWVAAQ
ncbi:hypothetical protein AGMMS49940_09760 [Spirochaetia bacterium]|nr:hypothetical protein AGMMS49940_09760 [Spirochaetia bacterium]